MSKSRLVATAGHVDHGKTALINTLTGQETDRLDEEQNRGLTIDLGFAHLSTEELEIGFIDVPGHQNFIKNMVSGVGSVQGILFVVSASDGWEAQSREHFEIIKLLEPDFCCFALTKIDLVDDEMQLLAKAEIEDAIEDTRYSSSRIIPVSSSEETGIESIREALIQGLKELDNPEDYDKPFCPIDRVFTVKGQGTVVTGSLSGGSLKENRQLSRFPTGEEGRIRGIQQYHESVQEASPGSRVAINIPEWDHDELSRGSVVTVPSAGEVTNTLDGLLRTPQSTRVQLEHDQKLLAYLGTARDKAQILTRKQRKLSGDEDGYVRLKWIESEVFTRPGDKIILRDFSDRKLLGCVTVLEVSPNGRLSSDTHLEWLEKRFPPTVENILLSILSRSGAVRINEVAYGTRYDRKSILETAKSMDAITVLDGEWCLLDTWEAKTKDTIIKNVEEYHQKYPLKKGLPLPELKEIVGSSRLVALLLDGPWSEELEKVDNVARNVSFKPEPDEAQRKKIEVLEEELKEAGLETPERSELEDKYSDSLIDFLLRQDVILKLSEDRIIHADIYDDLRITLREYLSKNQPVRLGDIRDELNSSRKYVIPLMEYLDRDGLTIRDGDVRYLQDSNQNTGSNDANE